MDSSLDSLIFFWFRIVSIITAVLPVCLSPIINSLCPLPIGIKLSIALIPVCIGSCTDFLGIIPGALSSALLIFTFLSGPFPSIGFPNPSTTLPKRDSPVGTSTIDWVLFTTSPSLIDLSLPKITTPTLSCSRFNAMPLTLPGNSTISPAWTLSRPKTLAIPSPTVRTVPTSETLASPLISLISFCKIEEISEAFIDIISLTFHWNYNLVVWF